MDGHVFLRRVVAVVENKVGILYAVLIVAGLFSPFILNDVVVIILTPVVIRYAKQFNVDPAPLLVTEIAVVNIASSLTPLGNPQNILLWSASGATLGQFVSGTWLPVLGSMVITSVALLPLALRAGSSREFPSSFGSLVPAIYLTMVALIAGISDVVGAKPYVSLGLGFLLGFVFTNKRVKQIAKEYDLRSLLTLYAFVSAVTLVSIFLVPELGPLTKPIERGNSLYSALFVGVVSNIISNVPATQMILNTTHVTPSISSMIAVQAGFAGNIDPIASFANILALQMARRAGIPIRRVIILQLAIGLLSFLPAL